MEYSSSFITDIPAPRVYAKVSNIRIKESELQRRLKRTILRKPRKYSKDSFQKYAPPLKQAVRTNTIKNDENLHAYRLYAKEQNTIKHKHELNVTIRQKYKMTLSEYRSRLYVEDPPNDVKTVTDIDKGFYNYVSGRSLIDHAPLYKTLKALLTHQLRTKLEVGYRNDHILNIEANNRNEIKVYEQSLEVYEEQTKYLENFISEDYFKSIALLQKCDDFQAKLNIKMTELKLLGDRQFTIISNLIGLDYMYYLQQSYGRFLFYLSPPSWRASHRQFAQSTEIEVKGFDLGGSDEETFNVIFDKMQKHCLGDLVSPALFFTEPHELIQLFEGIEKQQLSYIEYVTHLGPHLKESKKKIKALKRVIAQDSASVLSIIKSIEARLEFSEKRCAELENKFYKIINGLFYESVGAPEVIKLFLDLEFCYGKLYLEKPISVDIITLAKDLEAFYMHYWKRLDTILSDKGSVKNAVKQCVDQQRKIIKQAEFAKRELHVFECLKTSLIRAFAPPSLRRSHRKLSDNIQLAPKLNKARVSKQIKSKHSKHVDRKSTAGKILTASELEYLELFTDWTCNEDPNEYLHLHSFDEIKHN